MTDDLTQDALSAFWRSYTPEKLARARGLGDVLAYLKSCAASAAAQARRKAKRNVVEAEWDERVVDACVSTRSAEALALRQMTSQQLWAVVEACCNDERERMVARLIFLAGIKPRHVAAQFPGLFPDVSDVYRVKRNLLARLRRDATLTSMRENGRNERLVE